MAAHLDFLYEDLSCAENRSYYVRLYGLKDISTRVEQGLSLVGLLDRRNHRVRTLSNGMQKRLSIARALLHEPLVLLLDEPEAGLDQEALGMLQGVLSNLKGLGRSAVMTTHNVEIGRLWGDRVAVLSGGQLDLSDEGRGMERGTGGTRRDPTGNVQG
ncbi:MAG: ATP-binding cassette domain-containing protein [Dehalococcoidia bacterium]|nr:ATP-binding cassette domain-containing protein [Dehalococcoidia bacterium]